MYTSIEPLEDRLFLAVNSVRIDFRPPNTQTPPGYMYDVGQPFQLMYTGHSYGWNGDNTEHMRDRAASGDPRYDTVVHTQKPGAADTWELAVFNGRFLVKIAAGDPVYHDSHYKFNVEGQLFLDGRPSETNRFIHAQGVVTVTDGRLTISNAPGSINNKLVMVEITPLEPDFVWGSGPEMPVPRSEANVVVAQNKLFVFGGFDSNAFVQTTRADVFDPQTGVWTRIADMPYAFNHVTPVVDGDTIYFGGGFDGQDFASTDVWRYSISQNAWSQWVPLPAGRAAGGMAIVGRDLYFFGGIDSFYNTDRTDAWKINLDTGTSWEPIASLNEARNHIGAAVVEGKIYAVGGQKKRDEFAGNLKTIEVYDPALPQLGWRRLRDMPEGRGHISGSTFAFNGKILVAGGTENGDRPSADVLIYDPITDVWVYQTPIGQGRKSISGGYIFDKLILAGGYSGLMEKSMYITTVPRIQ
jgi:N-acetylneuraminic acid mutarotase